MGEALKAGTGKLAFAARAPLGAARIAAVGVDALTPARINSVDNLTCKNIDSRPASCTFGQS